VGSACAQAAPHAALPGNETRRDTPLALAAITPVDAMYKPIKSGCGGKDNSTAQRAG